MGYTTGSTPTSSATDALYQVIRSELTASGWTEHDVLSDSAGSRDIVFRGAALDITADNRPFVRINQQSTTALAFRCYSDWDTTTHAGVAEAGGTSNSTLTTSNSGNTYFIRANGVSCAIVNKVGTTYYKTYFGFLRRGYSAGKAGCTKTTSAVSAGASTIPVASDMTGKLQVDQYVTIVNYAHNSASANASNIEVRRIASIGDDSITFTSPLTKAFDAGAVVGGNPLPVCVMAQGTSNTPGGTVYFPFNLDGTRTNATSQTGALAAIVLTPLATSTDPGDIDFEYTAGVWGCHSNTSGKTGLRGYMYSYYSASANVTLEDTMVAGGADDQYICLAPNASAALLMKTS